MAEITPLSQQLILRFIYYFRRGFASTTCCTDFFLMSSSIGNSEQLTALATKEVSSAYYCDVQIILSSFKPESIKDYFFVAARYIKSVCALLFKLKLCLTYFLYAPQNWRLQLGTGDLSKGGFQYCLVWLQNNCSRSRYI